MSDSKPTESELEILQILWKKSKATVREVHEVLLEKKQAGYTTTLKLMQIMLEKGLVKRDDSARTHIYTPNLNLQKTRQDLLKKLVEGIFNGSRSDLVLSVLGDHQSSADELKQIREFLNKSEDLLNNKNFNQDSK
jgi:BlaI family penicillinase repressor